MTKQQSIHRRRVNRPAMDAIYLETSNKALIQLGIKLRHSARRATAHDRLI
jgi:hypothetical protein